MEFELPTNEEKLDGNEHIFYNWIIVPVLDASGIVVIQVPLGQLLQVLLIMVGRS